MSRLAWVSDARTRLRATCFAGLLVIAGVCGAIALASPGAATAAGNLSLSGCHLAGPYQHVIYIQWDNVHLSPSQIPSTNFRLILS